MKTVPYSDILANVCQLAGLDRVTLNDKSFSAIRDFSSRRLSVIWDREEWPDINRYFNTWPGLPVQDVSIIPSDLLTESNISMTTEADDIIFTESESNQIQAIIEFDLTFKRIYLQDFEEDAYRKGTISSSYVQFFNPFYLTLEDGSLQAINSQQYNFTYTTLTDEVGEYIETILIEVPLASQIYNTYAGPNAPLTTKVVFTGNKQLLIQLPDGALQALGCWTQDPRKTSRTSPIGFLPEDFSDQELVTGSKETNYMRVDRTGEMFVQYRITPTRLFGTKYDSTSAYSQGAQIYFDIGQQAGVYNPTNKSLPSKGNFFVASSSIPAGVSPSNQTSDLWIPVDIPARFSEYLCNAITADFLRSEGRAEEAGAFEQLAEMSIQQQIDVLIRQQGQNQRLNMAYTY
jgi:hypothetical protein